jgi:hypothetical protein
MIFTKKMVFTSVGKKGRIHLKSRTWIISTTQFESGRCFGRLHVPFLPAGNYNEYDDQGNDQKQEGKDPGDQLHSFRFSMLLQNGPIVPVPLRSAGSHALSA